MNNVILDKSELKFSPNSEFFASICKELELAATYNNLSLKPIEVINIKFSSKYNATMQEVVEDFNILLNTFKLYIHFTLSDDGLIASIQFSSLNSASDNIIDLSNLTKMFSFNSKKRIVLYSSIQFILKYNTNNTEYHELYTIMKDSILQPTDLIFDSGSKKYIITYSLKIEKDITTFSNIDRVYIMDKNTSQSNQEDIFKELLETPIKCSVHKSNIKYCQN